ncbi:MAG: hypothetical protein GY795_07580 [Desulfobacterales bacterium]|nr:hypothetical protein [Desulfobacterales bacterium]
MQVKKIFQCFLATFILSSASLSYGALLGDINGDGKIGIEEAVNALQVVAGLKTQPDNGNTASSGIEKVPASLGSDYVKNFDRYTKVTAPNGKAIHIVAQTRITNDQIIRARNVLQHFLTDLPNSQYGADKSGVANKMAENNAVLLLLNGRDDGSNQVEVHGQPLFEEEIQMEGHKWYINQEYTDHRDATFEEIFHLVHDYGIGVDGPYSNPGALPAYQAEIRKAQENALTNKLWAIGFDQASINEWSAENSLTQEYIVSVTDSYYGLWGAWQESTTNGMWGGYIAKTREEIPTEDPMGSDLMNKFFHPYLTYDAQIHADFEGTFYLTFDASLPYTHHSQYLVNARLIRR